VNWAILVSRVSGTKCVLHSILYFYAVCLLSWEVCWYITENSCRLCFHCDADGSVWRLGALLILKCF
jgi:hypothetical protein